MEHGILSTMWEYSLSEWSFRGRLRVMDWNEGEFISTDNKTLFYRWAKPENPEGTVVVVHGVCEYSGRYDYLGDAFLKKNLSIYSYDNRGHGKSDGKGTKITGFGDYVSDLDQFFIEVINPEKLDSVILMGHSMGSLIAALYILKHKTDTKIKGLVLASPPFDPAIPLKKTRFFFGKFLCHIFPNFTVHNGIKSCEISSDPVEIEKYDTDPNVFHKVTLIWGVELIKTIEKLKQQSGEIKLPLLILHGGADTIARIDGSRQFIDGVGTPKNDRDFKEFPELRHELHNEREGERQKVFSALTEWILELYKN